MDAYEISDRFMAASKTEAERGNFGRSEEYRAASEALSDVALRAEYGRVVYDMKVIMSFRPHYQSLLYGLPRYFGRGGLVGWCKWLTHKFNWDANVYPSFGSYLMKVANNVRVFFLWTLSPWFHIRYRFIDTFVNINDSKLMDCGVSSAFVRSRGPDVAYYRLRFIGFRYTLDRRRFVKDGENNGVNCFLTGFCIALNDDMTDEQKRTEAESYKRVEERVCTGWVFGWRSFVREMDKIVSLTPDMEWTKVG